MVFTLTCITRSSQATLQFRLEENKMKIKKLIASLALVVGSAAVLAGC